MLERENKDKEKIMVFMYQQHKESDYGEEMSCVRKLFGLALPVYDKFFFNEKSEYSALWCLMPGSAFKPK